MQTNIIVVYIFKKQFMRDFNFSCKLASLKKKVPEKGGAKWSGVTSKLIPASTPRRALKNDGRLSG